MESNEPNHPVTDRLGRSMVFLSWIAALALFTFLAQGWLDKTYNPNPSPVASTSPAGDPQITLKRNRYGHYVSSGLINGREAVFLLDTGATEVVIPAELAAGYGLQRGPAYQTMTANGLIEVYGTVLETIELGPLRLYNIRAAINPYMDGTEILLGMSFLQHLKFHQQGDELIISMDNG
ncbi:MAG TPA: TIGR02281 family clan AA aspartic protease [Gammaproteobacteria bacterium]|nr:TIGR02281 family clan AA aspartic protease [Gammaproteobacteria bacterium]